MKIITILLICFTITTSFGQSHSIVSPGETIKVTIDVDQSIHYSAYLNGEQLIKPSPISITINGNDLGERPRIRRVSRQTVNRVLEPVVPRKFKKITDHYNEMRIEFRGNYALIVRAYDEGFAYRWETSFRNRIIVDSELATFVFGDDHMIWFPEEESMHSHQERNYYYIALSEIDEDMFCSTATLIDLGDGKKAFISEAELYDYPGMFLRSFGQYGLQGKYAHYPKVTEQTDDRNVFVRETEDFLAETAGSRSFPWRVVLLTSDDAQLITSEIIYQLSDPLKLDDVSWIKPGKVAWDWWNDLNIYGVDFRAGINTATYKYYIDFASKYNIPYIIMDEGWYHLDNLLSVVDDIDIEEIIRYGEERNVGVILWATWKALDDQLHEALDQFEAWGVKGIKVDFMQRDDQWMVNYYYRVAREAAKRKLLVNFHGSYKPTGMRRAYPNVITSEAVVGLEHNKWSERASPDQAVIVPFIRMVTGPMDYTPGAMINGTKENFVNIYNQPMSQGTRCQQLAMYVVYESPMQMLSDNPSNYYREPESMIFLEKVPVVWDDTRVLHAKVGEYIALARQSADKWFIGAMTNWDARSMEIKLDFLEDGEYNIQIWEDGINADRFGSDYLMKERIIKAGEKISFKMAPGGGWAAIILK